MDALPPRPSRRSAGPQRPRRIARLDAPAAAVKFGTRPARKSLLPKRQDKRKTKEENIMTTQEFIAALRKTPDHQLIFENEAGDSVHAGYHLTEIKAAHFDTVDCGGQTNRWDETIVQLWVPEGADDADGYMTAGKFLRIFDKVTAMIPLN